MRNSAVIGLPSIALVLLGVLHCLATVLPGQASSPNGALRDSEELRRLRDQDQADRAPAAIDWSVVGPRDRVRSRRVKELFAGNGLHTANDYYHAAMILQPGEAPEDFLLAAEFSDVAMWQRCFELR